MSDVKNGKTGSEWFYSEEVKNHFLKPHNIATDDSMIDELEPNGIGEVGSPACGDVMKIWIKVDVDEKITKCLWRTFGCASAIASTSMLSLIITENGGMKIDDALKIKPRDIVDRLRGLPKNKIHCSILGDQALRSAIHDYFKRTDQEDRINKKTD